MFKVKIMNNKIFYKSSSGGEIMLSYNFNKEVVAFLITEAAFVSKILLLNKYDVLIELGCDRAKNYNIADLHKINYIGVDIRDSVIKKLENSDYNNATFYCFDFLNIEKILPLIKNKKSLCLFPFNLAGNIPNIHNILTSYKQLIDANIILSMWQCSKKANLARNQYYNNCGLTNLQFEETSIANNFVSNSFTSKSYKSSFLNNLITNHGFTIHNKYSNEVLQCWHFSIN